MRSSWMTAEAPSTRSHFLAAVWRGTPCLFYIEGTFGHHPFAGKRSQSRPGGLGVCLKGWIGLISFGRTRESPHLALFPPGRSQVERGGALRVTSAVGVDPEQLIQLARAGDGDALGQLMDLFRNYLTLPARLPISRPLP